ncbi:MAG: ABC transporter permease subunit, partial [Candidatus Binataceae bacterium]
DDSREALEAFGASGWLRFRKLSLPACVPKLVYNSILSWVAGWYFLIACEIITVGPNRYRLPGLGSYLMEAADKGRSGEIVAGLLVLLAIIVAMDFLIWQPLSLWSEKFRYEFAASSPQMKVLISSGAFGRTIVRTARLLWAPLAIIISTIAAAAPPLNLPERPGLKRALRIAAFAILIALAGFILFAIIDGIIALVRTLARPWPANARLIPAATGASILRMIIAYGLSLLWIMPCALYASDNPWFGRKLASAAEIIGSIPATALFPLIVLFVIEVTGGMNLASILLIITGMQWYLLFNLLAGVSQVPEDLKEATRAFGLSRYRTWRKLVIPSLMPSLITGSITAWGGGWNALILSEYFVYHDHTYSVLGLGALLDAATYQTGNGAMILLSLLSMVLVVIVLNRLLWRRLYNFATERYRLDY